MKYTAKIKNIKKDRVVATGEQFLDVTIEIYEEGKKKPVEIKKFGFPVETSEKEIKAAVKKALETFKIEKEQAVKQAKVDEAEANANKVIDNLVGQEVKS